MKQSSCSPVLDKPAKPNPDFPLFPHATKRWAKKIRGKFHFFGPWRDPEGAVAEWLRVKDHLLAGREPPPKDAPEIPEPAGMTVETVVNAFLTQKELLRDNGEIQPRTFTELHSTGVRIAAASATSVWRQALSPAISRPFARRWPGRGVRWRWATKSRESARTFAGRTRTG